MVNSALTSTSRKAEQGFALNWPEFRVYWQVMGTKILSAIFILLACLAGALTPVFAQAQAQSRPETSLRLIAAYTTEGPVIDNKVTWRVFESEPGPNGEYRLVLRSEDPSPVIILPVGSYLIHAAMGYARTTQLVQLGEQPQVLTLVIPAGALHLSSNIGKEGDDPSVTYDILGTELDSLGERRVLVQNAPPNVIIPLAEGAYQVISRYGDANAVIQEDVLVQAGQMTIARVEHRAARITFKLVSEAGGEALADTGWTILTLGGDVVKEGVGAFPTYILAEGKYSVIARNNGETFSREFDVIANDHTEVELLARRP